ncbi:FliM/FliN family flagellar motor switch protein [Mesorhizobium sp. LHD-90]|uniref:FliM/FliN family flagellar motor switch protein n=1 Tax=Mesorhizobium sp. LHD-90 TaxID=3071414 RepID=UPI0027E195C7|nr:FliM/FliN family flagellar motor switch protein [Mesorhizobium sp. LHD-90]MDQ6433747.1 FliM/FliN family flagellar motor switch protein [Mesorhizobium sp. LHD-90]
MVSPGSPSDMRAYIVERLVGDTGEPDHIGATARSVAERALPAIRKGFAASLATPVGVDIASVELTRFATAKPDPRENGAMAIASSPASPDAMVLTLDSRCAAVLVSALFGGDADMPVAAIGRPLSPTEIDVATMAFEEIARAVNGSGPRAFAFNLPLPHAISGAALAERVIRDGPAARVDFSVTCGSTSGRLSMFMPQRVLLKHRGDKHGAADQAAGDDWGDRFGEEVMRSAVRLEATMPLARMTLADLACLQPGQVIELGENAQGEAKLSARHKTLFVCEFGKLGLHYTVRIKQPFDERQELIAGLVRR